MYLSILFCNFLVEMLGLFCYVEDSNNFVDVFGEFVMLVLRDR